MVTWVKLLVTVAIAQVTKVKPMKVLRKETLMVKKMTKTENKTTRAKPHITKMRMAKNVK